MDVDEVLLVATEVFTIAIRPPKIAIINPVTNISPNSDLANLTSLSILNEYPKRYVIAITNVIISIIKNAMINIDCEPKGEFGFITDVQNDAE